MTNFERSDELSECDLGKFFDDAALSLDEPDFHSASGDDDMPQDQESKSPTSTSCATTSSSAHSSSSNQSSKNHRSNAPALYKKQRVPRLSEHGYSVLLFGDFIRHCVSVGDFVSVFSNRKRKYHRCRVTHDLVADSSSPLFEKYGVSYVARAKTPFFVRRELFIPQGLYVLHLKLKIPSPVFKKMWKSEGKCHTLDPSLSLRSGWVRNQGFCYLLPRGGSPLSWE